MNGFHLPSPTAMCVCACVRASARPAGYKTSRTHITCLPICTLRFYYKIISNVLYKHARVRFPAVQDFSPLHSVQTDSGAHPASYPMRTADSFPGGKEAGGCEADQSPPSIAQIKKGGAIPPLPHISSWHSA
jgi:hypothetical protein